MLSSDFHIKLADTLGFKEDYEKRLIDVNNRDLELKVRTKSICYFTLNNFLPGWTAHSDVEG